MMQEILFYLMEVVVITAVTIIMRWVVPNLISALRERDYLLAADIIENAVKAAEQIFVGHGRGTEKYEMVVRTVTEMLNKYHISITQTELEHLIESAVQSINQHKEHEGAQE